MIRNLKTRALLGAAVSAFTVSAFAAANAQEDKGLPTIAEKTEGYEQIEGLFPFYRNADTGEVLMEVTEEQLGDEFIAFTYVENGVLDAGVFKGLFADQRIIRFDKHFGALELNEVNTSYYFDPENAIAKAADANIAPAIIGTLDIVAETKGDDDGDDRYLIPAAPLFKSEMLTQINRPNPLAGPFQFNLGGLNPRQTKYDDVRGYPENVDVVVDYVFNNPMPFNGGSSTVTDARSVTLQVQHSLIEMPDDGYEPRFDDYRVGYFFDQTTDLTSYEAAPYRDVINRWRLEKKDPAAAISDPVKPITFWIENTTPVEYRDIVAEGVLNWNEAFEQAGFSNALEVKVQPDDAEWDAGDIRYNVLRWTSSPIPPFGGYGPSFTNPRTGEILGADIMLELVFLQNRVFASQTFESIGLPEWMMDEDKFDEEGHIITPEHDEHRHCIAGSAMQDKLNFGITALQAQGAPQEEIDEMVRQALMTLILHEVGHTLGLNHNMKATTIYGPDEIHDASVTQGAPSGSVMDYHATNYAPLGVEQGDYEHTRVGAYDKWAIEFGYKPEVSDPEVRAEVLSRSDDPMLTFGNDADDMRSPWNGIDPRVMIGDQSSDTIEYGIDRIKLVRSLMKDLLANHEGDSYQMLLRQYFTLTGQQAQAGVVMSKQIGGVYVERIEPGQETDKLPYTAVPKAIQKEAMDTLAEYVFAADAWDAPEDLIRHLQPQRRGYNFFFNTEDPKLHERVLGIQNAVLSQVLNPNVMRRMTNSALYGNEYSAAEVVQDLNDAIFGNDLMGVTNTYRRNLQIAYVQRLTRIAYGFGWDPVAQAAALAGIQDIKGRFGLMPEMLLPLETRAHRAAIRFELQWVG
ncbi:DUF5117 domain-containing protein [Parvularcula sp. ZS-1/3]|uniref:DUF5117 domain-containing protein n=1 Tax=Parvularcula mediterranea TaxID=2732508 RepID=A0A7Y3W4N9_9PROT|nr:zinc-dependent metalloprotease [Parvularcula mediterranea]NNU15950.1 DUF5117 domain-containing protein [Parvularcula mediterranea]